MRIVGVVQARTGSTRLPGKVLELIGDRPLVLWTLAAMRAVPGLSALVVATTNEPGDDPLVALLADHRIPVHRGPVDDVLTRCHDALAPFAPDLVVRETADNPFVDPEVVGAQVRLAVDRGLDYVGIAGWPLGIAAEVARWEAFDAAFLEATEPAEREHVMPFIYRRRERFRIGELAPASAPPPGRFTVDTAEDLAFARAIAERLGPVEHASIGMLRAILDAEPGLLDLNSRVRQKSWREAVRSAGGAT